MIVLGFAQDPQCIQLDKKNGLPSNSLYDVFQDSKGFMWFASEAGLVKYDGFEYKLFTSKNQSSTSGTNIQEDKYGRIWYQNFDGYVFYVENDSLQALQQFKPIGYFNYAIIKEQLFVMQKNCVSIYNINTLKVIKQIPINTEVISLSIGNKTGYFIYSKNEIIKVASNFSTTKIPIPNEFTVYGNVRVLSTVNNIGFYSTLTNKLPKAYLLYENKLRPEINILLKNIQNATYTANEYWFCTANGAYNYSNAGEIKNNGLPYFSSFSISDVLKDREGNYWFSTLNNGLLFVPNINSELHCKEIKPTKTLIYKNELYIGTQEGKLYRSGIDKIQPKLLFESKLNASISLLKFDSIRVHFILSNSNLEILDTNYQQKNRRVVALKDYVLIDSNYYAGAISGAAALFRINDKIKDEWVKIFEQNIIDKSGISKFLPGCRASCVQYLSTQKRIYFGTSYGLHLLTPSGIEELKIKNSRVYLKKLFKHHEVLYGYSNAGKIIKIENNQAFEVNLKPKHEIGKITFMKIIANNLVFASNTEFYNYNLNSDKLLLQHYINYDITDVEIWKNNLLITTKNGIIKEKLNEVKSNSSSPIFWINELKVNSKKCNKYEELKSTQNNIEILYSILSFKTDSKFPLQFKINDNNWEQANPNSRSLKLTSLEPGFYKIQFRLGDSTDTSFGVITIQFKILKPFWQTIWFILLCFIIIVLITVLILKWRINELNLKNNLLEEKVKNEQLYYQSSLKAIRAQMNPHFFYNALNTIQSFIYSEDKKNASAYLSKFSKLTRLILEMSEKEKISLTEEVNALQLYLDIEKARFNNDFEFNIQLNNIKNSDLVFFPPMLIQPHVENAVKHGLLHKKGDKRLEINFTYIQNSISVIIQDNGIGRKQSEIINQRRKELHTSFSTKANQERLEVLNKQNNETNFVIIDLADENGLAMGTKVILNISKVNFTN